MIAVITSFGTPKSFSAFSKTSIFSLNPAIHKEGMTFLVRQLAPTDKGLPIEIYVFVNDVRWVHFEAIQSDIFDHLLASLPIFGLRAFQLPSDSSFSNLLGSKA